MLTCEHRPCPNTFPPGGRVNAKRFCSERCRKRAEQYRRGLRKGWRPERRGDRCEWCGFIPWSRVQLTIDHIVPKSQGGGDEESNLQTLCHNCHHFKTAHIDRGHPIKA